MKPSGALWVGRDAYRSLRGRRRARALTTMFILVAALAVYLPLR